jgi:glutathionylspermidine synthase
MIASDDDLDERVHIRKADVRLVPLTVDYPGYRRQVIFQCFKWDPQVGDVNTVCDHACVLSSETASRLSRLAEALAHETIALEDALAERPQLHAELGISRPLRSVLRSCATDGTHVRVMRFDFHPTLDGWALSEVNSDVPGGFAESSALPKLAAQHAPHTHPGGDVAQALVSAVNERTGPGKRLAFVHATSYADDRQVMQFLASRFIAAGFDCSVIAPDHLRWTDGRAVSIAEGQSGPIDGIVRFFPADWLPALPKASEWHRYFSTQTLSCNPARALLSQSKRLPLLWDRLGVPTPTWRALLPETRDPRDAPWYRDDGWLLKPAFGRVGEGVVWRGGAPPKKWRQTVLSTGLAPRSWVAQRRFASRPLASREGPRHLCIGVFTVDGRAAGFYGRLSKLSVIEQHAQDVPILVWEDPP